MSYTATQLSFELQNNKVDGLVPFWETGRKPGLYEGLFDGLIDYSKPFSEVESSNSSYGLTSAVSYADGNGEVSPSAFFPAFDIPPSSATSSATSSFDFSQASWQGPYVDFDIKPDEGLLPSQSDSSERDDGITTKEIDYLISVDNSPLEPLSPTQLPVDFFPDAELFNLDVTSPQTPQKAIPNPTPSSNPRRRPSAALETVSPYSAATRTPVSRKRSKKDIAESFSFPPFEFETKQAPTTPRISQSFIGASTPRPKFPTLRRVRSAAPFVRGIVEDPFCNTNTAPMPPPRDARLLRSKGSGSLLVRKRGSSQKAPYASSPTKCSWTPAPTTSINTFSGSEVLSSVPPPPVTPVERVDNWWDTSNFWSDNKDFSRTDGRDAVRNASPNLARHADFGNNYNGDYNDNMLCDGIPENSMIHTPRSTLDQSGMVQNLALSAATMPQSPSSHFTPGRRLRSRTTSCAPRYTESMPTRLGKIPSISPPSSPSLSLRHHRSNESVYSRSVSGFPGDKTIRKRQASLRSETRFSAGLTGIGFVNFTPQDKQTLMAGVAPSGSSKTKAKREKEELERRRRLGEVAIKAVEAAGGDVQILAEEAKGLIGD